MKKPVKEAVKKSISKNYEGIVPYINKKFTPLEFESYCSNKINLFSTDPNFDFEQVNKDADKIIKCLPSIKRIFAKPIIDLIDVTNVINVENVKKIMNKTFEYSISHTSTIENIEEDGTIKPRKLLSIEYKIIYEIYENRCFTYLINVLLRYVKTNLMTLNNYLFINNEEINSNILEKLNHHSYYLAVGKLHTSYIRNFENSFDDILELMVKLKLIYSTLTERLKCKVYRVCNKLKKNNRRLRLKKTNIFRNQKDYKNIYILLRYMLLNNNIYTNDPYDEDDINKLAKPYFTYSEIILVFALMHFNFNIQSNKKLDFKNLDTLLWFKKYRVVVKRKEFKNIPYIYVEVRKEKVYKFVLYCGYNVHNIVYEMDLLKRHVKANEYTLLSPFVNDIDTLYLSVNNIDSFRRLQQLILRGMIYADSKHDICPFCGNKLEKETIKGETSYICYKCRTLIQKKVCPTTNKTYYSTRIHDYKNYVSGLKEKQKNAWIYAHNLESQMYYRNINVLDNMMDEKCPICGEIHTSKNIFK